MACPLPYPERFHAAVDYVVKPHPGAKAIEDETRLVLYALHQQATVGPCTEPKPWVWNVVESAKWQAWVQLGDMSSVEAMRLYVKLLDEEIQPDWWALKESAGKPPPIETAQQDGAAVASGGAQALVQAAAVGAWAAPYVEGARRPPPRYEHAVAELGGHMYVVGGNCGGRYLGDVWALELATLTWRPVSGVKSAPPTPQPPPQEGAALPPPPPGGLPPCAGHALVAWGTQLLCLGGHTKAKDAAAAMAVRCFDTLARAWTQLSPSAQAPTSRGSHSATLVGGRVFVFGGEDASRRPLGELHVLDPASCSWQPATTSGVPPSPRSAHTAVAFRDRFLLVFGGGSVAACYADLHALDTHTMTWSQPAVTGTAPSPRAGHAGALLGDTWYVAGGGNNASGCTDMLALDLGGLGAAPLAWAPVTTAEPRSAIASEGLSLLAAPAAGALVAFGGYNGRYHNTVQVFRPERPAAKAESIATIKVDAGPPAAPAKKAGDTDVHPPTNGKDSKAAPAAANGGLPLRAAVPAKADQKPIKLAVEPAVPELPAPSSGAGAALAAVQRDMAAAKEAAAAEIALMRRQLASAQAATSEAEKRAEAAAAEAAEEAGKVMRLEVALAECRQALARSAELEKEVERYRRLAREAEESKGKGSSVWSYISGAS
ncbi:hypothetical protein WJX81_006949 [Elliptochloris bilobata]|uniref:ACB domain-containing protein n=1 Tax=Elliptochloris bilobata TaxID=381761 RepID=A0AAW1QI40_9CHLO